jgi:uroporphyrinogen III methyltransferase/synthase
VVTFVTGHNVDQIDWDKVGTAETLVVFMGLTQFGRIASEIVARGRSKDTPAMAVRWATRPDQQTLAGTLETLPELIASARMKPPATIVIGEVVRLREKLDWYERLPLFGKRIVVTRAREQSDPLVRALYELGADAISFPTIEIQPAPDYSALDAAIAEIGLYDWVIFTSVNGVRFFIDRLDRSGNDLRKLRARICAIGPATRAAVERLHLKVDVTGEEYVAEGLLAALSKYEMEEKRVLLPRAAVARDLVPRELANRGAFVNVVEAYRTLLPAEAAQRVPEIFHPDCMPDWIAFTSSSTVQNFVTVAGTEILKGVRVASIGPITSATARRCGIEVAAEAREYTMDGLVQAIVSA